MNAIRTIRTIQLLALSALTFVAFAAASATGAQAGTFTASTYPANVYGTNMVPHKLVTNLGAMECAPFLEGQLAAASEQLTMTPAYGTTCSLGATEVHVKVNGCDYLLHAGETTGEDTVAGSMDIVCPAGKAIDFEITSVPICHLTVPGQMGLNALTFTNRTMAKDVDLDFALGELVYRLDEGCPGAGNYNNGSYGNGTTTMIAAKEGGMVIPFGVD